MRKGNEKIKLRFHKEDFINIAKVGLRKRGN